MAKSKSKAKKANKLPAKAAPVKTKPETPAKKTEKPSAKPVKKAAAPAKASPKTEKSASKKVEVVKKSGTAPSPVKVEPKTSGDSLLSKRIAIIKNAKVKKVSTAAKQMVSKITAPEPLTKAVEDDVPWKKEEPTPAVRAMKLSGPSLVPAKTGASFPRPSSPVKTNPKSGVKPKLLGANEIGKLLTPGTPLPEKRVERQNTQKIAMPTSTRPASATTEKLPSTVLTGARSSQTNFNNGGAFPFKTK